MSVEVNVVYNGNLRCSATHTPSSSTIITDAPTDNGGKGEAFSPTDLVAAAVGTCIMTIMGIIAKGSEMDLTGMQIKVQKEMAAKPSRRIGRLTTTVLFPKGLNLSDTEKRKLEKTVEMCPVKQSLHPEVMVEAKFIYS